jgi:hypothetical protein
MEDVNGMVKQRPVKGEADVSFGDAVFESGRLEDDVFVHRDSITCFGVSFNDSGRTDSHFLPRQTYLGGNKQDCEIHNPITLDHGIPHNSRTEDGRRTIIQPIPVFSEYFP